MYEMAGVMNTRVLIFFACCVALCRSTQFEQCVTDFENDVITTDMFGDVLNTKSPDYCPHLNRLIVYGVKEIDPSILLNASPSARTLFQDHLSRLLQKYGATCTFTIDSIARELSAGPASCDKCAKDFHEMGQIFTNSPAFCPALKKMMSCLYHEVDFDSMHMYSRDLGTLTKASMTAETNHLERLFGVQCDISGSDPNRLKHRNSGDAENGSTTSRVGQLIWVCSVLALWGRQQV